MDGTLHRKTGVKCRIGLCTGAVQYDLQLQPDEEWSTTIKIPMARIEPSEENVGPIRKLNHKQEIDGTIGFWKKLLERGIKIDVPDERVKNLFHASLVNILLLKKGRSIVPWPRPYDLFWFRDSAYMLNALDKAGFHDEVEEVLESYGERQDPRSAL